MPLARTLATRLATAGRRPGGAADGVLFLFYHDMRASEQRSFAQQIKYLRNLADLVGLSDALNLLGEKQLRGRYVCLTFDDGYLGAYDHALPVLGEHEAPAAFFIIPGWMDEARPGVMSWDAARHLARNGIEIGSHTLTHRRLADLSASEVTKEFVASRARIEAELGQACLTFAAPWGQPRADFNPARDPDLARAAGYRCFFTTVPRRAQPGSDAWHLPRVRMEPGWGNAELRYALAR